MDLDGYATSMREGVAQSFLENHKENLDDYISIEQVKGVIIGYSLGQDEHGNYLINEEVFNDTFEDVRDWVFNVGLSKLAAKGLVECAWDDNTNEMVFWCKDDAKTKSTNNGT